MQHTVFLRTCSDSDKTLKNLSRTTALNQKKSTLSSAESRENLDKIFKEDNKSRFGSIISQSKNFPQPYYTQTTLSDEEHGTVDNHLSAITDPLWKRICQDILEMMGSASVSKIWKSKLGAISSQDKTLIISCDDEETAAFVQQYDFVILGSLQKYFPALKHLKADKLI